MDNTLNPEILLKKNKKLRTFLIVSVVISILSLAFLAVVLFNYIITPDDENDTTPNETETQTEESTEVSEYTDIVLNDYDGLIVGIFEGFQDSPSYISGMVTYSLTSYEDKNLYTDDELLYELYGPVMNMQIINSKVIKNRELQTCFDQAQSDIVNKNLEANEFEGGYLEIFRNAMNDAAHYAVKEINVDYPNTDSLFAVLFIGGYQMGPYAYPEREENVGVRLTIKVFAIKGENLITLTSYGMDTAELGVSRDEHISCSEPDFDNIIDRECLTEILMNEKYDEKIEEFTDDLVKRFELSQGV